MFKPPVAGLEEGNAAGVPPPPAVSAIRRALRALGLMHSFHAAGPLWLQTTGADVLLVPPSLPPPLFSSPPTPRLTRLTGTASSVGVIVL